ncbi:DUF6776 family protein [Pigmentiphaga litoralis]|uniref:DUF6776 family protein n=1 Tax=Pigmentiphaga litoralis TaxID=516702 RepID=UPI003B42CC99
MKRRPLFPAAVQRRRRQAAASAPRAAKTRAPWPLRAFALLLILALGAALGSGLYEWVRRVAGLAPQVSASDAATLRADRERLAAELQALQGRLNAADGRIEMERAAKDKLEAELRASQKEVGDLRNDLAFFEQLIPADPRMGQVSIRSAELEKQGTALRYRVLLMRSGRPSGEFKGRCSFRRWARAAARAPRWTCYRWWSRRRRALRCPAASGPRRPCWVRRYWEIRCRHRLRSRQPRAATRWP